MRQASDVDALRAALGEPAIPIIAKIETGAAVEAAADILQAADAVMLARGDLGVDVDLERVPLIQKRITRQAVAMGVPAIIATHMLESMIEEPRPTRAEVSDIANAVLDDADAVMLSAESAIGRHPIAVVQTAGRIATETESNGAEFTSPTLHPEPGDPAAAVARAVADVTAANPRIAAIACFTESGRTAELLAGARPRVPIAALLCGCSGCPPPDAAPRRASARHRPDARHGRRDRDAGRRSQPGFRAGSGNPGSARGGVAGRKGQHQPAQAAQRRRMADAVSHVVAPFKQRLRDALASDSLPTALGRVLPLLDGRRREAFHGRDFPAEQARLAAIRKRDVADGPRLLRQFTAVAETAGMVVHPPADAAAVARNRSRAVAQCLGAHGGEEQVHGHRGDRAAPVARSRRAGSN